MIPLKWQKGRQPRRLLCFSAAFFMMALVFSLLLGSGTDSGQIVLLTAACACGFGTVLLLLLREDFPLFLSFFAGLLAGTVWCCGYLWLVWAPTQQYDSVTGTVRLELSEYTESKESYGVSYGMVTALDGEPCRLKVKAYLTDGSPDYVPGDVLVFFGELKAAERNWRKNLLQEGIYLTLSQESPENAFEGAAMTPLRRARILSREITLQIQSLIPGDEGALLAALLSGEREGFSRKFDAALTASGTRHITAVSGLHVTVLAGILISLLGKKAGLLVSVPVAGIYAGIVGFSPSVVRATLLLILWAVSFWLKLEKDSLTAFAVALTVLVACNPFSCLSAGLLLSFAATLGLILLSPQMSEWWLQRIKSIRNKPLKNLLRYVLGTVSATLAATLFTMPLTILLFDTVPLLGLLSNLLILWVLSFTMTLGIATLGISLLSPWAAQVIAEYLLIWPLRWMVSVINWIGGSRFAAIDGDNRMLLAVCVILIVAALLWRSKALPGKRLVAIVLILMGVTGAFTVAERSLTAVLEIENAGGQPVILLRNEGVSLLNSGARPQTAGQLVQTALDKWNASSLETVLCTTGDHKTQSGLLDIMQVAEAQRILLPCVSGVVSPTLTGETVLTYSRSGTITVSGSRIELLFTGEDSFALRLTGKRFSLLSLCGVKHQGLQTVLKEHSCTADILLVDDTIANQWQLLYDICQQVSPRQILITTSGYSEHSDSFGGIPITLIRQEGVQFRFLR